MARVSAAGPPAKAGVEACRGFAAVVVVVVVVRAIPPFTDSEAGVVAGVVRAKWRSSAAVSAK